MAGNIILISLWQRTNLFSSSASCNKLILYAYSLQRSPFYSLQPEDITIRNWESTKNLESSFGSK